MRSTFVIVVHLFLDFLTIEKEFQYRKRQNMAQHLWEKLFDVTGTKETAG